jgi:uncharacterized protein (TIRG00374 family)
MEEAKFIERELQGTTTVSATAPGLTRRLLPPGLKLALSAGLLAFLLSRLGIDALVSVVGRISPWGIVGYFLFAMLGSLISAWKWQIVLRTWAIELPYSSLVRWVLVGMFFNNLLPGGISGDLTRLYASGRASGKVADALAVLFYDRLSAFSALLFLGIGALAARGHFAENALLWAFFAFITLAVVVVFGLAALPWSGEAIAWLSRKVKPLERLQLSRWFESLRLEASQARNLLLAFSIAVIMQIVGVLAEYIVAVALQLPIGISDVFIFVPLLYLAITVPVSINGIGIREAAFVLFFSQLGITQAESVAFSLSCFTLLLLFSMVGGLIYLIDRN